MTPPNRPRLAKAAAAVVFVALAASLAVRHWQAQREHEAFVNLKAPLARALDEQQPLLARASALQPNFKHLSQPVSTARCAELLDLVRNQSDLDPFDLTDRSGSAPFHLDPCAGAEVYAEPVDATSQLEQPISLALQSHRTAHHDGPARVEVTTLWIGEAWRVVELQTLSFATGKTDGKPLSSVIRSLDAAGRLLERSDDERQSAVRVVAPDGRIQASIRTAHDGSSKTRHVLASATNDDAKAYVMATAGVWYRTSDGLSTVPRHAQRLDIVIEGGNEVCTYLETADVNGLRAWATGPGCEARGYRSTPIVP